MMTAQQLGDLRKLCETHYAQEHRRIRMLDATDNGDLWKALSAKFPAYQILPDTNWIAYVKANILSAIYTVGKSASLLPTSEQDKDIVMNLNVWLEHIWKQDKIGFYQFLAGERAALTNLGLTYVGWRENPDPRRGNTKARECVLQNVDPLKFMRDPFAVDLDSSAYCMMYDKHHKSFFEEDPRYADEFAKHKLRSAGSGVNVPEYMHEKTPDKDYYTLCIFWVWEEGKLNEYHVIDDATILYWKEDIRPSCFPIVPLYCNIPGKRLIGNSECAKVFANNTAFNLMDSIALTAEYKNQRPPRFISSSSGLNIPAFNKYGNEADHTFIVNGPAERAVHYHEFPNVSPNVLSIKAGLQAGIQTVSGVDGRYTGRDTGSILTTGGIEAMLDRATLIDTPKIMMYEEYAARLTELVVRNYLEYSPDREYFVRNPTTRKYETLKVPFLDIDAGTLFQYEINISSELPKNKSRVAQIANLLMEKQMQYGGNQQGPRLISEEEWLMMMDLPNKEYMLERMSIERMQNTLEDVAQTVFTYADLVKQGATPEDAMLGTAQSLEAKRRGEMPEEPMIPPVAQEQSFNPQQMQ
jgi:hypothetical protein